MFLDEDRLTNYDVDELSGDTINAIYKDTWLDAIETRTIVHCNKFDLITIPISIGYEQDFGKIGLGIDAGLSYGFFLNQKGRSINQEGEVARFDMNHDTEIPFKSSSLAYSISPMLDYNFNNGLTIRISPQFKFMPKSNSDFHGLEQKSAILSINGGIVFQIH
ncbi:MAG: hypothetical protein ACI9RU_001854 [Litorivivens sp.]|jgi:hypothetical protein